MGSFDQRKGGVETLAGGRRKSVGRKKKKNEAQCVNGNVGEPSGKAEEYWQKLSSPKVGRVKKKERIWAE